MGCTVTKVTPTESLHLENRLGETDSISTEETDSHPATMAQNEHQSGSKMYHKPKIAPRRVPAIDPFIIANDKIEDSVQTTDHELAQNSINPSSFLSPHLPASNPSSPFITIPLKNCRLESASQIDFFKMLDKKVTEGPDFKEN